MVWRRSNRLCKFICAWESYIGEIGIRIEKDARIAISRWRPENQTFLVADCQRQETEEGPRDWTDMGDGTGIQRLKSGIATTWVAGIVFKPADWNAAMEGGNCDCSNFVRRLDGRPEKPETRRFHPECKRVRQMRPVHVVTCPLPPLPLARMPRLRSFESLMQILGPSVFSHLRAVRWLSFPQYIVKPIRKLFQRCHIYYLGLVVGNKLLFLSLFGESNEDIDERL